MRKPYFASIDAIYEYLCARYLLSLTHIYTRGDTVTLRTTIPFHDGRVGLHRQCSLVLCQPLHDLFSVVGAGRALAHPRPFPSRHRLGREERRQGGIWQQATWVVPSGSRRLSEMLIEFPEP